MKKLAIILLSLLSMSFFYTQVMGQKKTVNLGAEIVDLVGLKAFEELKCGQDAECSYKVKHPGGEVKDFTIEFKKIGPNVLCIQLPSVKQGHMRRCTFFSLVNMYILATSSGLGDALYKIGDRNAIELRVENMRKILSSEHGWGFRTMTKKGVAMSKKDKYIDIFGRSFKYKEAKIPFFDLISLPESDLYNQQNQKLIAELMNAKPVGNDLGRYKKFVVPGIRQTEIRVDNDDMAQHIFNTFEQDKPNMYLVSKSSGGGRHGLTLRADTVNINDKKWLALIVVDSSKKTDRLNSCKKFLENISRRVGYLVKKGCHFLNFPKKLKAVFLDMSRKKEEKKQKKLMVQLLKRRAEKLKQLQTLISDVTEQDILTKALGKRFSRIMRSLKEKEAYSKIKRLIDDLLADLNLDIRKKVKKEKDILEKQLNNKIRIAINEVKRQIKSLDIVSEKHRGDFKNFEIRRKNIIKMVDRWQKEVARRKKIARKLKRKKKVASTKNLPTIIPFQKLPPAVSEVEVVLPIAPKEFGVPAQLPEEIDKEHFTMVSAEEIRRAYEEKKQIIEDLFNQYDSLICVFKNEIKVNIDLDGLCALNSRFIDIQNQTSGLFVELEKWNKKVPEQLYAKIGGDIKTLIRDIEFIKKEKDALLHEYTDVYKEKEEFLRQSQDIVDQIRQAKCIDFNSASETLHKEIEKLAEERILYKKNMSLSIVANETEKLEQEYKKLFVVVTKGLEDIVCQKRNKIKKVFKQVGELTPKKDFPKIIPPINLSPAVPNTEVDFSIASKEFKVPAQLPEERKKSSEKIPVEVTKELEDVIEKKRKEKENLRKLQLRKLAKQKEQQTRIQDQPQRMNYRMQSQMMRQPNQQMMRQPMMMQSMQKPMVMHNIQQRMNQPMMMQRSQMMLQPNRQMTRQPMIQNMQQRMSSPMMMQQPQRMNYRMQPQKVQQSNKRQSMMRQPMIQNQQQRMNQPIMIQQPQRMNQRMQPRMMQQPNWQMMRQPMMMQSMQKPMVMQNIRQRMNQPMMMRQPQMMRQPMMMQSMQKPMVMHNMQQRMNQRMQPRMMQQPNQRQGMIRQPMRMQSMQKPMVIHNMQQRMNQPMMMRQPMMMHNMRQRMNQPMMMQQPQRMNQCMQPQMMRQSMIMQSMQKPMVMYNIQPRMNQPMIMQQLQRMNQWMQPRIMRQPRMMQQAVY